MNELEQRDQPNETLQFYTENPEDYAQAMHFIKRQYCKCIRDIISDIERELSAPSTKEQAIAARLESTFWKDYKTITQAGLEPFWEPSHQEAEKLLQHGWQLLRKSGLLDTETEFTIYMQAMDDFRKAAQDNTEARFLLVRLCSVAQEDKTLTQIINLFEEDCEHNAKAISSMENNLRETRKVAERGGVVCDHYGNAMSAKEIDQSIEERERDIASAKEVNFSYGRLLAQFNDVDALWRLREIDPSEFDKNTEWYETAAELGDVKAARYLGKYYAGKRGHNPALSMKWYQIAMNLDPSNAPEYIYKLACLKRYGVSHAENYDASPEEFFTGIMKPAFQYSVTHDAHCAILDLADFAARHISWAREHKHELLPYFMKVESEAAAGIDACNSLTPREQKQVDCKAAFLQVISDIKKGTIALPEFASYQQLRKQYADDMVHKTTAEYERQWKKVWDILFILFALLPAWMMLPNELIRSVDGGFAVHLADFTGIVVLIGAFAVGIACGRYAEKKIIGIVCGAIYVLCASPALTGRYPGFLALLLLYIVRLIPWYKAEKNSLSPRETLLLERQIKKQWSELLDRINQMAQAACEPYKDAFDEGELEELWETWSYSSDLRGIKAQYGPNLTDFSHYTGEDVQSFSNKRVSKSSMKMTVAVSAAFLLAVVIAFFGSGILKDLLPEKPEFLPAESMQTEEEESGFAPDQPESPTEETVQNETETESEESGSTQGDAEAGEGDLTKVQSIYADKLSQNDALVLAQFADTPVMKQIQGLEEFMQSRDVEMLDFYVSERDENGLMLTYNIKDSGITNWIVISSSDSDSLNKLVIHLDSINMSTFWDDLCNDFYHLDTFALPKDLLETLDSNGYREEWEVSNITWSARVYYAGNQTNVVVDIF